MDSGCPLAVQIWLHVDFRVFAEIKFRQLLIIVDSLSVVFEVVASVESSVYIIVQQLSKLNSKLDLDILNDKHENVTRGILFLIEIDNSDANRSSWRHKLSISLFILIYFQ